MIHWPGQCARTVRVDRMSAFCPATHPDGRPPTHPPLWIICIKIRLCKCASVCLLYSHRFAVHHEHDAWVYAFVARCARTHVPPPYIGYQDVIWVLAGITMHIFCQQECSTYQNAHKPHAHIHTLIPAPAHLNTPHTMRIIITNATFHQMHSFVFCAFFVCVCVCCSQHDPVSTQLFIRSGCYANGLERWHAYAHTRSIEWMELSLLCVIVWRRAHSLFPLHAEWRTGFVAANPGRLL